MPFQEEIINTSKEIHGEESNTNKEDERSFSNGNQISDPSDPNFKPQ